MNLRYIYKIIMCIWGIFLCLQLNAQIKGTIVNEYGEPLSGVLITTEKGKNEFLTGTDGTYEVSVDDNSRYVTFSLHGYKDHKFVPGQGKDGNIRLEFDPHKTGGNFHLGLFTESKESSAGAVESVTGAELAKSPVSSLSQALNGRLIGLTVLETNNDLFHGSAERWIRGTSTVNVQSPVVVVDGVVTTSYLNFDFFSPEEIEDITILKDASANALYGIQGSNGVIVITTKRGYIGKRKIQVSVDQSFQQMTRRPLRVFSYEYAAMRNQAGVNDGLGMYSQFSQTDIDGFKAGNDPLYPDNDWYDKFIKDFTYMQRVGFNISGGSEKIRYFTNMHYVHQNKPFIIANEPGRKYDPTPAIHAIGIRSNIDAKLNKYLSAFIQLSGNITRTQNTPAPYDNNAIYSKILTQPSVMFGPLTPVNEEFPEMGNQVVTTDAESYPVYGILNRSGYCRLLRTDIMTNGGLNLDMGFLTQGLSAGGYIAYQTYSLNNMITSQDFERYVRDGDMSHLVFTKKGANENTPLSYYRDTRFQYNMELSAKMNYSRRFGDHSIKAIAFMSYQKMEKEVTSGVEILPYKRENTGISALYGFKDKYFIKGDLGYSGSEQFHPDHRYIATPAISASWIVSKEDFMNNQDILSYMKLRTSYGVNANDWLGGERFLYVDFVTTYGAEGLRGNPSLSAEKIHKQNYGIDLGFFSQVTLSVDYYSNKTNNMLVNSAGIIPVYQGIPLSYYPRLNNGKMENSGVEIVVSYRKQLSQHLSVFAEGAFSHITDKVININELPLGDDYAYPKRTEGYMLGQQWGLLIDYRNGTGMFNTADELASSNLEYAIGNPRVGDFIYKDLNNDNIINDKDLAPIGSSGRPRINYNFSGGFTYKDFEFSFLFQGIAKATFIANSIGAYEFVGQGVFNDIHFNAFTPERYANKEKITFPALSLSQSTSHRANDFFSWDRSFLRLKNVEIAYTLPSWIAKKISAEKARLTLNGQNLFTIDNLETRYLDPEVMSQAVFQPYRTFNIGVSVTF
ncbi:MAG: SusC/RagA family TonB-linked outer membrane protein [Mangrovibacterium sp.]